jgi:hypothetical protein
MRTSPLSARPARRKAMTHRLIRQIHLWIGAWGAIAAILFGGTGIVLNHRFAMELPQGERAQDEPVHISVPIEARATPQAMAGWLTRTHGMRPLMQRVRPAGGPMPVGNRDAAPSETWSFGGGSASEGWSVEYAAGDANVKLERSHYSMLGSLVRLHKSGGGGIGWILLGDSFGLAMLLLGITGITMWTRGRSPRQMALSVLSLAIAAIALVLGAAYA